MAAPSNPKLEAVNDVLEALGYSIVNSLDTSDPDVVSAVRAIDRESRVVQSKPYWFNTTKITLKPDDNDEIILPQNTSSVEALRCANQPYAPGRFMRRGVRLFDTNNNTYTITENVDAVLVIELDYNDLPYTAQNYVTARAISKTVFNLDKSTSDYSVYKRDEQLALVELNTENINSNRANMLVSPEITLNKMVGRLNNTPLIR